MRTKTRFHPLAMEIEFTEAYRRYEHAHSAIREAMCLRAQYPASLQEIRDEDLFAGRAGNEHSNIAIGFVSSTTYGVGFICEEGRLREKLRISDSEQEYEQDLQELLEFWKERQSTALFQKKLPVDPPEYIRNAVPDENIPEPYFRLGGCSHSRLSTATLDFDKLLRLGIPGMIEEIERYRAKASNDGGDAGLYEGMRMCLNLFTDVCHWYAAQAHDLGRDDIAEVLEKIAVAPPETLQEAIQLFWLYALMANINSYGRMDIYLGDFYARDIDSGRLTAEEAISLIEALWKMISEYGGGSTVMIGGLGRRNEENADRFALAAMEATRRNPDLISWAGQLLPQLRLRTYQGMNPAVFEKALEVLGEGGTFPVLFNDEVCVPAAQQAFACSREDSEQYVLSNCGDVSLEHRSFGSPNSHINFTRILEITLRNGINPLTGERIGLQTGEFKDFKTFEQLTKAYKKQVEFVVEEIAQRHEWGNETLAETSPFLFMSMLYDDCLERGKGCFAGGLRYFGALVETPGITTAGDSLAAIKELVYDKKLLTQERMLAALEANFEGYEKERSLMLQAPKFGNDDPAVDNLLRELCNFIFTTILNQKHTKKLDYLIGEYVDAGGYASNGLMSAATPDGRLAGTPHANSHNPRAGNDRNGVTAMLNSMTKFDAFGVGGAGIYHGVFLDRKLFDSSREIIKSLVEAFFANGGNVIQITATSKKDLEKAFREPEKYPTLMVRVGGFSARFIELDKNLQQDIINRTLY